MLKWAKALIKGTRVDQTREGLGHPAQCITLIEINEQQPCVLPLEKCKYTTQISLRTRVTLVSISKP